MRYLLTLTLLFFSLAATGQRMRSAQWDEEAKTNSRLLPKYGHIPKTDAQKEADKKFIETALKIDTSRRTASEELISLGFGYLSSNLREAMYRFNQAYLLDSTNTDIYWGFGAVYMQLRSYERAKDQYTAGLKSNPKNTHLLTDYGSYFMAQFYGLETMSKNEALANLDSAIAYMTKSYKLDPGDQNTTFKLSVCYWNKGDCDNAWKYYDVCKLMGGEPITEDYTNDLQQKCVRKK